MPEQTLRAFADHRTVARTLDTDPARAQQTLADAAAAGIELSTITGELEREGVQSFCDSYHRLLDCIESKIESLPNPGMTWSASICGSRCRSRRVESPAPLEDARRVLGDRRVGSSQMIGGLLLETRPSYAALLDRTEESLSKLLLFSAPAGARGAKNACVTAASIATPPTRMCLVPRPSTSWPVPVR
jgi:Transaldolase/Fructose-6-phosphate aldolase